MFRMRRLMAVLVLALGVPLYAQVHEATPLNVLLDRLGVSQNHHDMAAMAGMGMPDAAAAVAPAFIPVRPAGATKTFNITAHQFQFDVTPSPFIVNVGDDVTLNITVPSTDGSSVGHGFFLETYMVDQVAIARGHTVTVHFVATAPGTFTYLCTVTCGDGHPNMHGTMTVDAAPAAPTITSISPSSGPASGGTQVTIKGSGFESGATVTIGSVPAANVNVVDDGTIIATTPAAAPTEELAIPHDVIVTNPDGTNATLAAAFTYTLPQLSVAAVQPDGASPSGGTTVAILGNGFTTAVISAVTFGGVPATDVKIVSLTVMTVTAPPHGAGKADVVVTVGPSTATLANGFTYANEPVKRRSARK